LTSLKIIGIIQARMHSQRLLGKVMLNLIGKPLIWHIYNRLRSCKYLDEVVISTGEYSTNKEIIDYAQMSNIPYYSGSEKDLIDRLYQTAIKFQASAIVRVTADCPLVDPIIVDKLVQTYLNDQEYDIVTNCKVRTFPHGLDVELYSNRSLEKMWKEIKQPEIREWFPFFVEKNPSLFKVFNIGSDRNLSHMRWTVDYPEDFELIKIIYQSLFKQNKIFTTKDVLDLLEKNPKLVEINSKYAGHHNVGAPNI